MTCPGPWQESVSGRSRTTSAYHLPITGEPNPSWAMCCCTRRVPPHSFPSLLHMFRKLQLCPGSLLHTAQSQSTCAPETICQG